MGDAPALELRAAVCEEADARFLLALRNAPEVRARSGDGQPIDWDSHWRWFAHGFAADRRLIFIGEEQGQPVGYVRLDREDGGDCARVSLALAAGHRGRGLGARLLDGGLQRAIEAWALRRLVAEIQPDNAASLSTFERCGFRLAQAAGETHQMSRWTYEVDR